MDLCVSPIIFNVNSNYYDVPHVYQSMTNRLFSDNLGFFLIHKVSCAMYKLFSMLYLQECLPLIDDLSNLAMRTRHWKQLVRVTGGAVQVDNDTLKRMTLGELLSLGLQSKCYSWVKHSSNICCIFLFGLP
jgi:hypothetical protein